MSDNNHLCDNNHLSDNNHLYDNNHLSGALIRGIFTGSLIALVMITVGSGIDIASEGLTEGTRFCLSYIAAGLTGGILQQIWFNYRPTRRFAYSLRLLGFGLSYYVVLTACATFGQWLPSENPWAWATFTVIFLVILALLTLILGAVLRRRGIEYKAKLDEYHARKRL